MAVGTSTLDNGAVDTVKDARQQILDNFQELGFGTTTTGVTTTGATNKIPKIDSSGVLNVDTVNANHVIENTGAYGLRWNATQDEYTRLGNAIGKSYSKSGGVVTSDFDSISPWSDMRRCNLADNLTVNAYYGDAGYVEDGTNGEVMVEVPHFYFKKVTYTNSDGDKIHEWWVSEFARSGYELHPAFKNTAQNKTYDNIYYSAFEGYNDTGTLRSISGVQPTTEQTIGTFRTQAEAHGAGWTQQDFLSLSAVQILYLIEFGDFKSQQVLSDGIANLDSGTANHSQNTGHTSSLGNASGEVVLSSLENGATGASETYPMSYRGIENLYGNIWKFTDGIILVDNGVYLEDDISNFNDSFTGYAFYSFIVNTSNGYISDYESQNGLQSTFIPSKSTGGSTTYASDYYYAHNSGDENTMLSGGRWFGGSDTGTFTTYGAAAAPYSARAVGARLMAKK